jgi:peptidoglycan hydrolase-like protein with peptidoglycan-binding domain
VRSKRSAAEPAEPEAGGGWLPRWLASAVQGWSRRDAVGVIIGALATIAILANVLFMQPGPHPAPMVRKGIAPAPPAAAVATAVPAAPAPAAQREAATAALPRPRPGEAVPKGDLLVRAAARAPAEIISDIQRELARRGFYDGTVDGRYGPRTDAAVRDFEQAAGLRSSSEPSEALLRAIKGSTASRAAARAAGAAAARPAAAPARSDPIAEVLAPSSRVLALQRALAEFGYAQIKPTGVVDPETRAAIERFERERKLPVTGQVSDRVTRELASLTGRPLE